MDGYGRMGNVYTKEINLFDSYHSCNSVFNLYWEFKERIHGFRINKLYNIPYTENPDILWVRTDWLKEVSMENPKTWHDFFDTIEKLTNLDENPYDYSIRCSIVSSFQLKRMKYAYSGISDYIKYGKSSINGLLHVEFLKKYFSIYQKYSPISDIRSDFSTMLSEFDNDSI